jgi:hypothetical protein
MADGQTIAKLPDCVTIRRSASLILLQGRQPSRFAPSARGPVRLMSGPDTRPTYPRDGGQGG